MLGVVGVYLGLICVFLGGVSLLGPMSFLGIRTRGRAALILALGFIVAVIGGCLPAMETRVATARTHLDQFAMDAGCTPAGILPAHLPDQMSDLLRNEGASELAAARLPSPEQAEASAMPRYDRFRPDDGQR
jgi:hypothetical protein